MRNFRGAAFALALLTGSALHAPAFAAAANAPIEFELMTWAEVKAALAAGKTTALFYTGGVEQRGPQNANGGHNMMARPTVKAVAEKLGNAIAMPVLPFTPTSVSADLPGSLSLPPELLEPVMEQLAEDTIKNGFKNVILMADSGGGQGPDGVYDRVAKKLDAKYKAQGVRVFYADEIYTKANREVAEQLVKEGHPPSTHGGILDTSMMLYLDTDNIYVRRDLLPTAVGDPVLPRGQKPPADYKPINNGINGDARRSSAEIGKRLFDAKVEIAVKQIQGLIANRDK
jgi:creatinine amidohydrolase